MHQKSHSKLVLGLTFLTALTAARAHAFEGHISAITSRGGPPIVLLYTVGTNCLRIEMTDTNSPNTVDILDRNSGTLTLLFPQNRCFMQLKPAAENSSAMPPGIGPTKFPGMPGSRPAPATPVLPGNGGMSSRPAMPMLPPGGGLTLQATGGTTNLLGYTCARYEIKQRGEVMEIWATDQLLPYQPWMQNQPPRFGPQMIEEQWGELVKAKKLFPLLATLKFENGSERLHFEVKSVKPEKIEDPDGVLFRPPANYQEIEPLPF